MLYTLLFLIVTILGAFLKMADSYIEEYLPLKSSPEMLDEYIFFDGRVRIGKILEGNLALTKQYSTLTMYNADSHDV
jgi:acyl-coenzyme A thioesterase 9